MADAAELIRLIKKVALGAVEAKKPVEICFGRVAEDTPLKIRLEQKMELGEAQLVLSRNVTDFKTYISGRNLSDYYYKEEGGESADMALVSPRHVHAMGKMEVTIHNGLAVGDEVILLRMQGGQKYIVWDRIG